MLGGRYGESMPIAREANEIAKATGERQLEGHSAATLGIDMVYVGAGRRRRSASRRFARPMAIAEEVRDVDDIGRGYACLSSALDVVGRSEEGDAGGARGRRADEAVRHERDLRRVHPDERGRRDDHARALGRGARDRPGGRADQSRQRADLHEHPAGAHPHAARQHRGRAPRPGSRDAQARPADRGAIQRTARRGRAWSSALLLGDIASARVVADEVGPILEQTEDLGTLGWFLARADAGRGGGGRTCARGT